MRRKLVLALVCAVVPVAAFAHLCNDVFAQAKDNLVVKVDVRDGQLRIGQEASFRVYLMNTMDRDIANIKLEVRTDKFRADVKPSENWRGAPKLKTVKKGGKKEYYEVTLTRNAGVPDGEYKIDLHLFNGKKPSMVFKTVDLGEAAGLCELPKAEDVKVATDGKADGAEWEKSFLCTEFYSYEKTPCSYKGKTFKNFPGNVPAENQSRFRVSADAENIYCLLGFQGADGAKADFATMYVAAAMDEQPVKISFDRLTGKVSSDKDTAGVEVKIGAEEKTLECKIPRKLLGIDEAQTFFVNFTRTTDTGDGPKVTYWRGNDKSLADPLVYGQFKFAE